MHLREGLLNNLAKIDFPQTYSVPFHFYLVVARLLRIILAVDSAVVVAITLHLHIECSLRTSDTYRQLTSTCTLRLNDER